MRRLFVVFLAAASAKEFFHAVDNADCAHNQQFAEFDGKGGDDREQAEFFRRQAADQRGIPFVWFPGTGRADGAAPATDSVKDIRSGEQVQADPATWVPSDPADLAPRLVPGAGVPAPDKTP